jgi:hypothetical protein
MEQQFLVRGRSIKVTLREHSIHIVNDEELWRLLNGQAEAATDDLIEVVKREYERLFHMPLDISDASLAVEIWGHIYCDYFARILEETVDLNLVKQLTDKIASTCKVIDCGESSADNNRFFWNMVAPFKKQIAALLPRQMDESKLRKDVK